MRGALFSGAGEGGEQQTELVEYGPSNEGEMADTWRRSVFFHLLQTEGSLVRVRFHAGETTEFPTIAQMRDDGMSDVVAIITRFAGSRAIGEMDLLYCYWATDHPQGFDDAHVEALSRLMPTLALAVKCVSLARIAGTLVETYLGRDAGRRVLNGLIRRGVADQDQRRAVVQRPARIHPHHGSRRAGADHPAAQRLCRGGDLRDLR